MFNHGGTARRAAIALLGLLFAAAPGCARRPPESQGPPPQLWFYQEVNLSDRGSVDQITPLWIRAVHAGYSRVVLADYKFGRLSDMNSDYFEHAARLRTLADSLGLAIMPGAFQIGRSGALLSADPNLVEALPIEGALFEVRGGVARLVPDPPVAFPARPAGHDFGIQVDARHAAIRRCLWRGRWWYDVPVSPHRSYHVSWWIRTREFKGRPQVRVVAGRRAIHFMKRMKVSDNQEWTRYDLVFNSFEHTSVRVSLGVWRRTRGLIEWRDWSIEEAGPVNLVRRDDAPFWLREDATGQPLTEGVDYAPVADTLLGRSPWAGQFDEWHTPPEIHVRRPDGTRLRASWQSAAIVYEQQVTCCLSEPATFARLEDEARRLRALWGPGRYLMMFDEIRALGQDSACVRTGLEAGQILARAVRRCASFLPKDTLYVWNDMFDPLQNAVRDYFLVRGDLTGAWEGLEPGVGVLNWNAAHGHVSLRFFADRGHRQVIAGYYDGKPSEIRGWLEAARGVPRVEAILYATWEGRYDDLEAFAEACRTHP